MAKNGLSVMMVPGVVLFLFVSVRKRNSTSVVSIRLFQSIVRKKTVRAAFKNMKTDDQVYPLCA